MSSNRKRKALGELAWVMDGKTEYHGRLVEPMSASNAGEDDEVEVQWGHNGRFEWVAIENVRIETSARPSRRTSASPAPKKNTISPKKGSSRKRKHTEADADETKSATKKATRKAATGKAKKGSKGKQSSPKPKSSRRRSTRNSSASADDASEKPMKGSGAPAHKEGKDDKPNEDDTVDSSIEAASPEAPPAKRQKAEGAPEGLFANFSAQAFSAKDAVVNGFMGFYKSVMGS